MYSSNNTSNNHNNDQQLQLARMMASMNGGNASPPLCLPQQQTNTQNDYSQLVANMLQVPQPQQNNNEWLLNNLKQALNVQQQPQLNLQDLFQAQQQQPTQQQDSVTDWIRAMMSVQVPQDVTVVSGSSTSSLEDTTTDSLNPSSHEQMWKTRYHELKQFHQTYGHSLVPMNWPSNPSLAHWVKRQRYQYKLKYGSNTASSNSTLTAEREAALRRLHFVWDSHAASWEERYQELIQFSQEHGHANVPKHFPSNPKLSIWVKCQRRQYKLLLQNKKSNMTLPRFTKLQHIGFCFCPRGSGNSRKGQAEPIPEALLRQAGEQQQQQPQSMV